MKVFQTTLTEAEHKLLKQYAKRNSMSGKQVLREAIKATVEGNVNPMTLVSPVLPAPNEQARKTMAQGIMTDIFMGKHLMLVQFRFDARTFSFRHIYI